MPIYEYRCPDCGHEFERIQSFSDAPITVCPECEGEQVKKKISLSAFSLKGSGWYKDHYGLKSGGSKSDAGSSSGSSSSGSSSSSSASSSSSSSD
jgi:putative FmdB family regulatory protein